MEKYMTETVSYLHSVNSGDLISSLPGMKHVYDKLGKKAVIIQRLNMPGEYFGQAHPVKSDTDETIQVTMNSKQWSMLKPLLEYQPYVDHCEEFEGQHIDVDFDKIRSGAFSTMPHGSIHRWNWYAHPALACDLSIPWIEVPESKSMQAELSNKIIVNRTERYTNPLISFFFLKKWEGQLLFAGTEHEWESFNEQFKLNVHKLEVRDFLQLAQAIKYCKLFLGNQSFCYNIAEAMKTLRVLEVCRQAANCVPMGPLGYDYLQQGALEFYVEKFMK